MGDIYKQAKQNYVWLGEGNAATDRTMHFMGITGLYEYFMVGGDRNGAGRRKLGVIRAFLTTIMPWNWSTLVPKLCECFD